MGSPIREGSNGARMAKGASSFRMGGHEAGGTGGTMVDRVIDDGSYKEKLGKLKRERRLRIRGRRREVRQRDREGNLRRG